MAELPQAAQGILGHTQGGVGQIVPPEDFESRLRHAAGDVLHGLDEAVKVMGQTQDGAADLARQAAAQEVAGGIGHSAFSWSGYIQAIGLVFLLLAALWLALWLLRRYGRFSFMPRPGALPRDALFMEAQLPLGPRKGLMVVRFLNRRLLLGVTEHRISLLAEDEEEKKGNEPADAGFARIMADARGGADAAGGRSGRGAA